MCNSECNCEKEYISKQIISLGSDALNDALAIDRKAIVELMSVKVNCSRELMLQHPTLMVAPELDSAGNEIYTVSVISLLNSVLDSVGLSKICACFPEDGGPEDLINFIPLCEIEK